jgi:TIR domain
MRSEYDVFLSHKNLEVNGQPSRDAALAQELYDHLSGQGLRVFLSSVSLELLGVAAYKKAIDDALDSAQVLVAVGTSAENLESQWVRYEWESFFNDILSGRKPKGRVFSYVAGVPVNALPRTLRQNQVMVHQAGSHGLLYNFIVNALAIQSVARITQDGKAAVDRLHRLVELMAESRLLELEITAGMFGHVFSTEQRRRLEAQIGALRQIMSAPDAEPR